MKGLPYTFACKNVTMASSPRSNSCSRTKALNALLAVLTFAKAKCTKGDRTSPLLKASVFGYAANRVCKVSEVCASGIDFLLLIPDQPGIKSKRRLGEDPIAIFGSQHRQTRLAKFQQFRERSLRRWIVRSPRDTRSPEFRYKKWEEGRRSGLSALGLRHRARRNFQIQVLIIRKSKEIGCAGIRRSVREGWFRQVIQNNWNIWKALQHVDELRNRFHRHLHAYGEPEFARALPGWKASRIVDPVGLIRHRAACRE